MSSRSAEFSDFREAGKIRDVNKLYFGSLTILNGGNINLGNLMKILAATASKGPYMPLIEIEKYYWESVSCKL